MHRRTLFFGAATVPLLPRRARGASTLGETIAGDLRAVTKPGNGDNRATYMPDGRTLLFISSRSGKSQIWAADPDGANPRRVHESAANDFGQVASSPDGARVCFSSDREGENAIYVLERATDGIDNVHPGWSPGGRAVVFTSGIKADSALHAFTFA